MSKGTKRVVAVYAALGIGLVLFMGILSFLLSVIGLFSDEENRYVIETVSSLSGSIYLAFLLLKLNKKTRERKFTSRLIIGTAAAGLSLALIRCADRALLVFCEKAGLGTASYLVSSVPELAALAGIFFLLPVLAFRGKEAGEHA